VVALRPEDSELIELHIRVARLEAANAKLRAVLRLLLALVSVLGGRLWDRRVEHAADKARLLASASPWYREFKRQGLRRPRKRVHAERPKHGVRASRPNELWHIDASQVRLLDGTKAWLHAVIDNASRKVLAWTIVPSCEAAATLEVLREAVLLLPRGGDPTIVVTDDGRENVAVEDETFVGILQRITAQVDVSFSNSMVENLWHQAKHRLLCLHKLDNVETLRRLFAKYVDDHNGLIPRVALGGRTPDEVYFGTAKDVPAKLAAPRAQARVDRVAFNRA
jgi:transposase InsO family protein